MKNAWSDYGRLGCVGPETHIILRAFFKENDEYFLECKNKWQLVINFKCWQILKYPQIPKSGILCNYIQDTYLWNFFLSFLPFHFLCYPFPLSPLFLSSFFLLHTIDHLLNNSNQFCNITVCRETRNMIHSLFVQFV